MTAPTAASPTPPQDSSSVFNTRSFADLVEVLRTSSTSSADKVRATVLFQLQIKSEIISPPYRWR